MDDEAWFCSRNELIKNHFLNNSKTIYMANKTSTTEQSKPLIIEVEKTEYDRLKRHENELKKMREDLIEMKEALNEKKEELNERLGSVDKLHQLLELLVQKELLAQRATQQSSPIQQGQFFDSSILEMSSVFGNIFQDNVEDKNEKTSRPQVKLEGAYKAKYEELLKKTKELTKTSESAK
jgi:hypothetical protein